MAKVLNGFLWAMLVTACSPGIPAADAWTGTWTGPEGTFLQIAGSRGRYEITIKDLDAARSYQGEAAGDRIVFSRDGIEETVRATTGTETGMKWLADKQECLTVRPGEGYCRR